jgi:hypothetical protein
VKEIISWIFIALQSPMTLARFESVNLDPMSTLPLRREGITGE